MHLSNVLVWHSGAHGRRIEPHACPCRLQYSQCVDPVLDITREIHEPPFVMFFLRVGIPNSYRRVWLHVWRKKNYPLLWWSGHFTVRTTSRFFQPRSCVYSSPELSLTSLMGILRFASCPSCNIVWIFSVANLPIRVCLTDRPRLSFSASCALIQA